MFVAPSVQWVRFPSKRIVIISLALPCSVIIRIRFVSHQYFTQILPEISCYSVFVVYTVECKFERFRLVFFVFGFCKVARLVHLRKYHVSSFPTAFGFSYRIEVRRVFTHAYKHCAFCQRQIFRLLAEICCRSRFYPDSVMQEIKIIEIQCKYLILCICPFKHYSNNPFYRFLYYTFSVCACR